MKKKIILGVALIVLGLALAVVFIVRMSASEAPTVAAKPVVPSGQAEKSEQTPAPEPTPTPTPEPDTTPAFVVAKEAPAVLGYLMRGDEAEVIGNYEALDGYYVVKTDMGYGIVEKTMLRLDSEQPYAEWQGYAAGSADIYSSLDMVYWVGSVYLNDELTVLDDFGYAYLVDADGVIGFMLKSDVNDYWVDPSWNSGGGGGGDDPGGGGGDSGSGNDGGDISLASFTVEQAGEPSGKAVVRADNTALILAIFEYDEEVKVISSNGDTSTIWFCGLKAEIETRFIRMEGAEAYTPWTGYMRENGLYDNILLVGDAEVMPERNTEIEVLNDFDGVYLVRYGDKLFYTWREFVSDTYIEVTYYGGGGDSGGEWTEPVL